MWSLAGVLLASSTPARADTAACMAAHEKGQEARARGAMREARQHFLACGVDGCPAKVRRDCLQWAEQIGELLPSIVVGVRDEAGNDVIDVRVTIDGLPAGERLDGRAIPLDPGPHDVEVDGATIGRVTKRVLVREGDRAAKVDLVAPRKPAAASTQPSTRLDATTSSTGPGVGPWLVMGGGALVALAGVGLLLAAPALPPGCDRGTGRCEPLPSDAVDASGRNPALEARKATAGEHSGLGTGGLVTALAGGAIAAGGLVWYLAGRGGSSAGARVSATPWVTLGGAGAGLSGTF